MDKNSVIGFILIAAILFGFTFYQSKQARRYAEVQAAADSIAMVNRMAADSVEAVFSASKETPAETFSETAAAGKNTSSFYKDSLLGRAHDAEPAVVCLENDRIALEFTTRGGQPYSARIKDFFNYDSTALYLFKPGGNEYSVSIYAGEAIRTGDFTFDIASKTDSSIVMRLPFSDGGYIEQKYVLHRDSYLVDNELSFVGMQKRIPRNVSVFDIDFNMTVPRMEKGYKNESQYSKLDYYFEGDKKPSEMGRGRSNSKRIDSKLSWFAFNQQFFSAIIRAPKQFASGELAINFAPENDPERNLMSCSANMRGEFVPGQDMHMPVEMYFGPNHFNTLEQYGQKYEKIIPLGGWLVGWFTRYAIIPMFNWFHKFIGNFGLIILLMTIVIKVVVLPLTYKSYASTSKMSALKPEIDKINEKYPRQEDAMKKQQATMDLYKRAGVSPMGGCLPTLLTFPILWAMFRFFPASIELRQQPFLWCHDLSAYDSILDYGMRIPILGDHLSLFALLMAVTMWLYSKMTLSSQPSGNDPNAASMRFMSLWLMPVMMFFICNSLSAALSYYYLVSQLISILQIWLIKRSINTDAILEKVRLSQGKPLPKSKWVQRLEAAQKMQMEQQRQQQKRK